MMKLTLAALLGLQMAVSSQAAERTPITENDLKHNPKLREMHDRMLGNSVDAYGFNFYSDSSSTQYDGYQQAWRYLGWYVSCGTPSNRYDGSGDGDHHSHDDNEGRWMGNNYCQRYLMWAGYVDLNYQGGGTGEYAYYDPYSGQYDYTACNTHGGDRCALMDCHESESETWTLIGVFKEASYFGNDAFFEQLFKHEGVCLWNDDDVYDFMSETRENLWPQGCVQTAYYDDDGNYLYLDLKPTPNGNMTLGLYSDYVCSQEYLGGYSFVDTVASNMGLIYGSYVDYWNTAMEVYKVCQPCRTYNLQAGQSNYDDVFTDDDYQSGDEQWGNPDDDQYQDANEGYFWCSDDAGYTNVNQCMKFRTHADLEVATWEDLVLATNQGGILPVTVGGTVFGTDKMSYQQVINYHMQLQADEQEYRAKQAEANEYAKQAKPWMAMGKFLILFGAGALVYAFIKVFRRQRSSDSALSEQLI